MGDKKRSEYLCNGFVHNLFTHSITLPEHPALGRLLPDLVAFVSQGLDADLFQIELPGQLVKLLGEAAGILSVALILAGFPPWALFTLCHVASPFLPFS